MASPQALVMLGVASSPTSNTAGGVFSADYHKLSRYSRRELKAIRVQSLLTYFFTVVDYRNNHNLLRSDALVYMRGLSNFDIDVGLTVTDWFSSNTAQGSLGLDVAAILKSAADFTAMPEQELDKIIVFLRAQLGV